MLVSIGIFIVGLFCFAVLTILSGMAFMEFDFETVIGFVFSLFIFALVGVYFIGKEMSVLLGFL